MLKPNKIRQLLAISIVLAGACLTMFIVARVQQPKGPEAVLKELPKNIDLALQKIHYTEVRNGEKRWELTADRVDYERGRDNTSFRGISMELFARGNGGRITLTADRGSYHNKNGDLELAGNVTALSDTGMRLTTGRLRYVASRSLVETDDHVRFVDGRLSVEGTGLELLLRTKSVRVLKDVKASILARTE